MRALILSSVVMLAAACAGPDRRPAVPPEKTLLAALPGFPDVRYRPAVDIEQYMADVPCTKTLSGSA